MHVFTYGTLMFPAVWQVVAGRGFPTVQGTAPGFLCLRVQGAQFPGIVAAGECDRVRGVLYLDVDDDALKRLDRFEDDFYQRQSISIDCADGVRRAAAAYVVPTWNRTVLSDEPWNGDDFVARGHLAQFLQRFTGFSRLAELD